MVRRDSGIEERHCHCAWAPEAVTLLRRLGKEAGGGYVYAIAGSPGCDTQAEKALVNDCRLLAWMLRVLRCTASRLRGVLLYCYLNKTTHWCPLSNENREDGKLCRAFVPSPASPKVLAHGPSVDPRLAPVRAVSGAMHIQGTAHGGWMARH